MNSVLLFEGSLFRRDLSIRSSTLRFSPVIVDFIRYELLKVGICIVCFLPVCHSCAYLIPFVLYYCYTFLQNPELDHGR